MKVLPGDMVLLQNCRVYFNDSDSRKKTPGNQFVGFIVDKSIALVLARTSRRFNGGMTTHELFVIAAGRIGWIHADAVSKLLSRGIHRSS